MNESSKHEQLSAYLDGELSADERARIERWLADDAEARRRLDELRAVSASVQALPAHRLDEDLADRVLLAAEHRILTEPTSLADAPRPASEPDIIATRHGLWQLLSPRAVAWAGLTVAVAILLTIFPFDRNGANREMAKSVAKSEKRPDSSVSMPVIAAAPETSNSFVDEMTHKRDEPKGLSAGRHPITKSDAGERFGGDSKRFIGNWDADKSGSSESLAKKKHSASKSAPRGVTKKAIYDPYAAKPTSGEPQSQASLPPHAPKRPQTADGSQREFGLDSNPKGQNRFSGEIPDRMFRKGRSTTQFAITDTAVQRALRNQTQNGLLVVKCEMTPKALEKQAFTQTLLDNSIDVVAVEPNDKPLAEDLVRNQAQFTDGKQAILRRRQAGLAQRDESRESSLARRPNIENQTPEEALSEVVEPRDDLGIQDWRRNLADGSRAEVVLVEGSPEQIMATVSALGQRRDMVVSIEPQEPMYQWGFKQSGDTNQRLQHWVQQNAPESRPSKLAVKPSVQESEQINGRFENDSPQNKMSPRQDFSQQQAERGRAKSRGTAQRIGTVRWGGRSPSATEPPADEGKLTFPSGHAPRQPLEQSPKKESQKKLVQAPAQKTNAPRASTPESPTAAPLPPLPPPPIQGLPGLETTTEREQSNKEQKLGEGLGGMGGLNDTPDVAQSGKTASPTTPSIGNMPQTPYGTLGPAATNNQQQQEGQATRGGVQLEPQPPRLQILFVLQQMPSDQPPPAAAKISREKPEPSPAKSSKPAK